MRTFSPRVTSTPPPLPGVTINSGNQITTTTSPPRSHHRHHNNRRPQLSPHLTNTWPEPVTEPGVHNFLENAIPAPKTGGFSSSSRRVSSTLLQLCMKNILCITALPKCLYTLTHELHPNLTTTSSNNKVFTCRVS